MIVIDSNQASMDKAFYTLLNNSALDSNIDVFTSPLETGDLQFWGKINSETLDVSIGIEIKKVPSDLMGSLRDGRLMTQLPRMVNTFDLAYLLLVGEHISVNFETGKIREKKKRWADSGYSYHYLNSVINKFEASGGRVRQVKNIEDMTIFVLSLYRFWRKSSHAEEVFVRKHHKYADWKVMDNPLAEVYERMGIGVQRAVTLAETYPTMNELCKATQKDIVNLKGFGKITAEKVLKFTRGRED